MAEATFQLLRLNTMELRFFGVALAGVTLPTDGSFSGTFQVDEILDTVTNAQVTGQVWPAALSPITGTKGDFRVYFDKALVLVDDREYLIKATLADGPNRDGHWEPRAVAKTRDGIIIP